MTQYLISFGGHAMGHIPGEDATGRSPGGPYPEATGGFTLIEVPSREEALQRAARIAVACRCAQEVREIGTDPGLDVMLGQADSRR